MNVDIAKLKDLAEKATPGAWMRVRNTGVGAEDTYGIACAVPEPIANTAPGNKANAAYIAAASPDVVLALINCIERLEKEAVWLAGQINKCAQVYCDEDCPCSTPEEWRKEARHAVEAGHARN